MSLDELRRLGTLVREDRWSRENHRSNLRIATLVPVIVVGLGGCAIIGLGDGGWLTWTGVVAFLAGLFTFIAINVRGVDARARADHHDDHNA